MKIVITGGTGLLGRALTQSFVARQHTVVILSRNPAKHQVNGATLVQWSAKPTADLVKVIDSAHTVINLAGASIADKRWTPAQKKLIIDSRVSAGHAITQAIAQAAVKPKLLLQASAVGYYGTHPTQSVDESSPAGDDFPAQVTQKWEPSTQPVTDMGVRRAVLRIGVVLAAEGGALPKMLLPFKYGVAGRLSDGDQWLPWVHIDDVVRAVHFLMENNTLDGPFNLVAPAPLQNREFTNLIGTILNRPVPFVVPAFVLKLALGEMSELVLHGRQVQPRRLIESGFGFRYVSAEQALRAILH